MRYISAKYKQDDGQNRFHESNSNKLSREVFIKEVLISQTQMELAVVSETKKRNMLFLNWSRYGYIGITFKTFIFRKENRI